jgi:hypothetical protein
MTKQKKTRGRNRSYPEIIADSGTARAKELHENKQSRLDSRKERLQQKINEIQNQKAEDAKAFAEAMENLEVPSPVAV